jgi:hypothetical protein
MRSEHAKTFKESQLPFLTRRAARPATQMFARCLFCDWRPQEPVALLPGKSSRELEDILRLHIAEHLQYIALLALPEKAHDLQDTLSMSSSSSQQSTPSSSSRFDFLDSDAIYLQGQAVEISSLASDVQPEDLQIYDPTCPSRDHYWGWVFHGLAKAGHITPCKCFSDQGNLYVADIYFL